MILLSDYISADEQGVEAVVHIDEASAFYDADCDGVPSWVGIEYMAQAIAVWAGVRHKLRGDPIEIGFLLGTQAYQVNASVFSKGSPLIITVIAEYLGDEGLGSFACQIHDASSSLVCQATINAYSPDDSAALIAHLT